MLILWNKYNMFITSYKGFPLIFKLASNDNLDISVGRCVISLSLKLSSLRFANLANYP